MGKKGWLGLGLAAGVLVALVGTGVLLGGPRAAVDWRSFPVVALQSDDWGLAGFIPQGAALQGIDRGLLSPGRFPEVYWGSTLEDSASVAELCGILAAQRGRDGLPAVLQANYVLGSLGWESEGNGWAWREYFLPEVPAAYARPGLWQAVRRGMELGVWRPEYHALWHYDPRLRKQRVQEDPAARLAAERGVMIFPGSERAWELGPWRPLPELAAELDLGLQRFGALFGRGPSSIIAPDYTWDARCEDLWESRELTVIQAKREQRYPGMGAGWRPRLWKYLRQRWDHWAQPDRLYLERNCRFEPVQAIAMETVVQDCLAEIRRAWTRGQPAVVESHRINFVHTDPQVAGMGRAALAGLLSGLTRQPQGAPYFLADGELAQLMRQGTSSRPHGSGTVVRNPTHGAKVAFLGPAGQDKSPPRHPAGPDSSGFRWVLVPGRSTLVIDRSADVAVLPIDR
jgi:hypothetical protein